MKGGGFRDGIGWIRRPEAYYDGFVFFTVETETDPSLRYAQALNALFGGNFGKGLLGDCHNGIHVEMRHDGGAEFDRLAHDCALGEDDADLHGDGEGKRSEYGARLTAEGIEKFGTPAADGLIFDLEAAESHLIYYLLIHSYKSTVRNSSNLGNAEPCERRVQCSQPLSFKRSHQTRKKKGTPPFLRGRDSNSQFPMYVLTHSVLNDNPCRTQAPSGHVTLHNHRSSLA